MSCVKYQQMISQLLDGELQAPAAEELRIHLGRCSDCRTFSQGIAALDQDLRTIESVLPRSALAEQVKERIADLRSNTVERHWFPSWVQIPLVAVLVLCALGVGNLAGRSLSGMFVPERKAKAIDLLVTDAGHSFTDVLLEIGMEGNTQ
jgi:predicted anti-sigma-YlaC factor YlaD